MKTRNIVIGGLLTALSIMIPMLFAGTPLMVYLPPGFTATVASHVPSLLAMAISPGVAVAVGVGSALGFTLRTSALVGARALMHAIFGGIGGYAYQKGMPFAWVLVLTAPIHGLLEALVVIPFGLDLYQAFVVTGIGTVIHHSIDAVLTVMVYQALVKFSLLKKPSLAK